MADWKFTDEYGTAYPALVNSILNILVFDVPSGTSPVGPDGTFSAPLNLTATGAMMNMLANLTGMVSIAMTGTVSTDDDTLTVSLESTDEANVTITSSIADCIPLIGGSITQDAGITVDSIIPASLTSDDSPETDTLNLIVVLNISGSTATITTDVPMSDGIFTLDGEFENFSISLSDLDFLVDGDAFSAFFPTDLPSSYYNASSTKLSLLSLDLTLLAVTTPSLSVTASSVTVSIGIENIPLLPNGLFLNPLAVWIAISEPATNPDADWGLSATLALYPYGQQTDPPTANPDFTFEIGLQMPGSDSTFAVSGEYSNPYDLPVSQMICDLLNDGNYNTGIASDITLEKFDFTTVASSSTGTISSFDVEIGMSSPFGLFATPGFGVQDFNISVSYTS